MLEGKCKEDFEKWLEWQPTLESGENFNGLDFSLQSGVYLEYLDSVGYHVEIFVMNTNSLSEEVNWVYDWSINDLYETLGKSTSRQEALKEAITKANEIYNK
jgi:hypothetical protein